MARNTGLESEIFGFETQYCDALTYFFTTNLFLPTLKASDFLMFSLGVQRDQWYEMG